MSTTDLSASVPTTQSSSITNDAPAKEPEIAHQPSSISDVTDSKESPSETAVDPTNTHNDDTPSRPPLRRSPRKRTLEDHIDDPPLTSPSEKTSDTKSAEASDVKPKRGKKGPIPQYRRRGKQTARKSTGDMMSFANEGRGSSAMAGVKTPISKPNGIKPGKPRPSRIAADTSKG